MCQFLKSLYIIQTDGVVATLVQVHRTLGDVCMVHTAAGAEARATLLAYRVLAPFVVIRVMPCLGDKHERCEFPILKQ